MNYGYGEYDNEVRRNAIKNIDSDLLEVELFMLIENHLLRIIELTKPRDNLVIAIDGVTPLAKMFQQRSRRIKALEMKSEKDIKFDSNCITAGTDFMRRLDKFFVNFISKYAFLLPPNIFYSSHLVPGEGEIKILNIIRKGRINGNGAHIMYGLDADLIIHCLLSPLKYMYLIREDVDEVLNIEEMRLMLAKVMLSSSAERVDILEEETEKCKIRDYILDFALIVTLVGNDFIPPLSTFQAINDMYYSVSKLLAAYRVTDMQLVDKKGKINLKNLRAFFKNLHTLIRDNEHDPKHPSSANETPGDKEHNPKHPSSASETPGDEEHDPKHPSSANEMPRDSPHASTNPNYTPEEPTHHNTISEHTSHLERKSMCKRYIEGMQWTVFYYLSFHIDKFWYYNFNTSPTSKDLLECKIGKLNELTIASDEHFNLAEYLLIVLPNKDCIPKNLKKYFREFNKILPQTAEVPEDDIKDKLKERIKLIKEKDKIEPQKLVIIRRDPQKQERYQKIKDFQNRLGVKICMKK
jgi:5'-3' exonuclease